MTEEMEPTSNKLWIYQIIEAHHFPWRKNQCCGLRFSYSHDNCSKTLARENKRVRIWYNIISSVKDSKRPWNNVSLSLSWW